MSDILDEVLSEQKEEKRLILFQRFFPVIIICAIIIALMISFYSWYQNKQITLNQESGSKLIEFISNENNDKILNNSNLQDFVSNGNNRQIDLATLKIVHNKIELGETREAFNDLEKIILDSKFDHLTKSYARIIWISLAIDKEKLTDADNAKIIENFDSFKNDQQEFYSYALLLKAFYYKKINQSDLAKESLEKILKTEKTSSVIKEQAKALLSQI